MKLLRALILTWALLPIVVFSAQVQEPKQQIPGSIADAELLNEQGHSRQALEILQRLLQQSPSSLDQGNQGIAWNVMGCAYREMDRYDEARHSYETSIHLLRGIPDQRSQLASAINNLGGLEERRGQLDEAKSLRKKALRLYQEIGSHAGVAFAASNLANIAIAEHDPSAARKWEKIAFEEASQTTEIDKGNQAAMYTVKAEAARLDGRFADAIVADQRAIDLFTDICRTGCPNLGLAYSLRGEAYGMLKNYPQAISDFQRALSLLEPAGRDSPSYLRVEFGYAGVLRSAGSISEASRLEAEARGNLEKLRKVQCNGCTISAESFRGEQR